MTRLGGCLLDFAVWLYTRLWHLFLGLGRAMNPTITALTEARGRVSYLLRDLSRSDGNARPTPYGAANTSLSHEAIGLWTALGALTFGAPIWGAVLIGFFPWGVIWEGLQYRRMPTVRVLRDTLLGDNPSYLAGALAIALVWEYGFVAWLAMTPVVIIVPIIMAVAFGRIPK
jgi:hypothetical protein